MIINGHPLDLTGSNGELISIKTQTHKAVSNMLLNGSSFMGTNFTLSRPPDVTALTVSGLFTDTVQGGGWVEIQLTAPNGTQAVARVTQPGTASRNSITFTIDVV